MTYLENISTIILTENSQHFDSFFVFFDIVVLFIQQLSKNIEKTWGGGSTTYGGPLRCHKLKDSFQVPVNA